MPQELVLTLGVTQQDGSHRLKSLGMIHNQRLPYQTQTKEFFIVVTSDKKWFHCDNPQKRTSWCPKNLYFGGISFAPL